MTRRTPHETEPKHQRFLAWPHHADWRDDLDAARRETRALAAALAPDPVQLLALPRLADGADAELRALDADPAADPDPAVLRDAEIAEAHAPDAARDHVVVREAQLGDVWLRDTGPVFTLAPDGPVAVSFAFNGWGGKYVYPGDEDVARQIAGLADIRLETSPLVTEGGALEFDGAGTAIVTRDSILNANRNPSWTAGDVERELSERLGVARVIWLEQGLLNDHTDGHADTIARFVRPGLVACMAPSGRDDPNARVLDEIARTLDRARDADGRRVDVARIPSPGLVRDADGRPAPASHLNWVFSSQRLVLPTYGPAGDGGDAGDGGVRDQVAALFPDREVVAASARAFVAGGGAFHCASVESPHPGARA